MKKNRDSKNLGSIYEKKRKSKLFPIIFGAFVITTILIFILLVTKVYQQANELINVPSDPFPDVSENAMPVHSNVSFQTENNTITLEGWLFNRTSEESRGNIIFVHNNHANRVQYGLETADLFSNFMSKGFNILAFDLRHSGRSSGSVSTYGYSEYKDVISAIEYMKKLTGDSRTILFGTGSGTATSLLAWHQLESLNHAEKNSNFSASTPVQEDIIGFILDTPTLSADDYIRADIPNYNLYDNLIAQKFVPAAIKATTGFNGESNNISIISQIPVPVLITRNIPDTKIAAYSLDAFTDERLRLHPETTSVFETSQEGHINGFNLDQEMFLQHLDEFLDIWFADNSAPEEITE